jgi:hypothetical protein
MLAPNGQSFFPVSNDWETTFTITRDVLGRCTEYFEAAVGGKPLKFQLHAGDNLVLASMYDEYSELETGQLHMFTNHVLALARMPYRISMVGCSVENPLVYYCSVRRESFRDIQLRMGEAE